jgi:hypothetical protein
MSGALLASSLMETARAAPAISLREAARKMALYGLPLIEMAQVRQRPARVGFRANQFQHSRELTTPATQRVTAPNSDTLYSVAWLDLSQGPVRLTIPPTGQGYFSLALMDMYSNNFAVLGARTIGTGGGSFVVIGPNAAGLDHPDVIRAPTDWVWALARTVVSHPGDLFFVHALQDGLIAEGPTGRTPIVVPPRTAPWHDFFKAVQALVLENPPPATDTLLFRDCAVLGLTPRGGFDSQRFSAADQADIAAGLRDALEEANAPNQGGAVRRGWVWPHADLGDFGQDYVYRAQIALSGLAALPRNEAVYMRPLGPDGQSELDGRRGWRLHAKPAQLPPVDGFWSLTAYEVTPQGQAFLVTNALQRYALGDRTPGLRFEPDGSLDLWITPGEPGPERRTNWLPSTQTGRPMILSFRAFLPQRPILDGTWEPPVLHVV